MRCPGFVVEVASETFSSSFLGGSRGMAVPSGRQYGGRTGDLPDGVVCTASVGSTREWFDGFVMVGVVLWCWSKYRLVG